MKIPCGPAAVMEEYTSLIIVRNVTERSGRLKYVWKPEPEDLPYYRMLHKATVNSWCRKKLTDRESFYYAFYAILRKGHFFFQNILCVAFSKIREGGNHIL